MSAVLKHIDFEVPNWGEFDAGPQVRPGYYNEVLADRPLAYWRLGESRGPIAIDEMGHCHGTYQGGISHATEGALAFDHDRSVQFDGSTGYIDAGNVSLLSGSTACSIEFWLYQDGPSITSDGVIMMEWANGQAGWLLWVDQTGWISGAQNTLTFVPSQLDVPAVRLEGPTDLIRPNMWDHFVCTFQGGEYLRIYRNTQLMAELASNVIPSMPIAPRPLLIGKTNGSLGYLKGRLDELAVYDLALTPDRIAAHYNAGAGR